MKRFLLVTLAALLAFTSAFAMSASDLKDQNSKVSYALGYDIGNNFKQQNIKVDADVIAAGIKDALTGQQGAMTEKEVQATLLSFQKELLAKRAKQFESQAKTNAVEGEKFLAANKGKNGVITLKNGLQYKVLEQGTGKKPQARDTVTVDYEGKTIAGTVFDSSYKHGKPVSFRVDEVIPAWSQALQMMKEGATWMVYAPPKLAYGKAGIGGPIGPEQTLIFKIHLISTKQAAAGGQTADKDTEVDKT